MDVLVSLAGGAAASLIAVLIWEFRQRARLGFRSCTDAEGPQLIQTVCTDASKPERLIKRAIHHVFVENVGIDTASQCTATLSVYSEQDTLVHSDVEGIWNRGLQPMLYTPIPKPGSSETELVTGMGPIAQDAQVIWGYSSELPGHAGFRLPIIIKYDNDDDCYLFDINTYVDPDCTQPKVAARRLAKGEYRVRAVVTFDSPRRTVEATFLLRNHNSSLRGLELSLIE